MYIWWKSLSIARGMGDDVLLSGRSDTTEGSNSPRLRGSEEGKMKLNCIFRERGAVKQRCWWGEETFSGSF